MPNRLAQETSPYLLQHKDNPVDWYPWGEEAFDKAQRENKPIFLSVGYSACHWCHVMEHESFEDPETAALMNDLFVNIKVDREERPDVDAIYMGAVQALTGRGGWPMSVWLLPDQRPFYGGTYFPDAPRHGMPSFRQVLTRLAELYRDHQAELERDAGNITKALRHRLDLAGAPSFDPEAAQAVLQAAFQGLADQFDQRNGGFGMQPKFPPAMTLELLLRLHHRYGWAQALKMVQLTLDKMAWGGMYDQLGGGFARYSVDAVWLVPHFEKMLYDNALLIRAYLYAYQQTEEPRYRQIIEETAQYIRREMTAPDGGFYASQDADSEGKEGKFFIWKRQEIEELLGEAVNQAAVLDYWGVNRGPNFEGHNILWVPDAPEEVAERHGISRQDLAEQIAKARTILFSHREGRIRPGRDEKILTAWNAMMIHSLAQAGRALGDDSLTGMAVRAADFVLRELRRDGRLLRSYKDGQARFNAYLEDYALLAEALIELYQTTFEPRWYWDALSLVSTMVEQFWDEEAGFYDTSHDHEELVARPQEISDNAIPSGTSAAVAALLRMAILADRPDWREKAEKLLARLIPAVERYPQAFPYLASQLDFAYSQPHEVALVGDPLEVQTQALLQVLRRPYRPNQVVAFRFAPDTGGQSLDIPLLEGRDLVDGKPAVYVCQSYVCQLPVNQPEALVAQLRPPTS